MVCGPLTATCNYQQGYGLGLTCSGEFLSIFNGFLRFSSVIRVFGGCFLFGSSPFQSRGFVAIGVLVACW